MSDGTGPGPDGEGPQSLREWLEWLWTTDNGIVLYVREIATSVAAVLAVGLLLFLVSGVWPPMVAVESSSMNPHMQVGDLVFVMDEHRLAPGAAYGQTGVVTYQTGKTVEYTRFGAPGDVIIYHANGQGGTPIIHRARFWVNESENWYDEADPSHLGGADDCRELDYCPAPHGGFITKGDNEETNRMYDQVNGLSAPVKPSWIVGTAEVRIPLLGYVKLCASGSGPCFGSTTAPPASARPSWLAANATAAPTSGAETERVTAPTVGAETERVAAPTAGAATNRAGATA